MFGYVTGQTIRVQLVECLKNIKVLATQWFDGWL
jgi:hypothetical protein